MKAFTRLILGAALVLLVAVSGFAQTTTTVTTLAAAITTSTQDRITLTSATGVSAGVYIYAGKEEMRVGSSYVSGVNIPVVRGRGGVIAPHLSGETVTIGVTGNFVPASGALTSGNTTGVMITGKPYGPCSPTAQKYTIVVHVDSGNRYSCIGDTWANISGPDSNVKIVSAFALTAAIANVDSTFFVADRPYRVIGATEVHNTIEDSAAAWQLSKDSSTNAPGAGVDLLATAFDLTSTTRVPVVGTLTATPAYLHLVAGDRLSWDASATTDTVTGVVMTVTLVPE